MQDFIGELSLLSAADENMTEEMKEKERQQRIDKLSSLMIVRLQPVVDGKSLEFERTMMALAEDLKQESFGFEIIQALGYIYDQKAKQFLGKSTVTFQNDLGLKRKQRIDLTSPIDLS